LHRVVYSLYPDVRDTASKVEGERSGFLYADQGGDFYGRKILLLSDREPADRINEKYGQVYSKRIPDGFLDHDCYRFKVIVNPTWRDSATRKLLPVKGRESVADWFSERAINAWGFQVTEPNLQVDAINVLQFKDKQQRVITLAQAHLQGLMKVTDPMRFQQSFTNGIGRGRSFGCGLLQLVPFYNNPFSSF
jgi:CRISPR system Cascade subunit CasE